MLTNEQCIEVAEKVWGWVWSDDPNMETGVWFDENRMNLKGPFVCYKKEIIVKYVNSWEGFGRTVEAMAGENIIIQAVAKHYTDYLRGANTKEELWKRTHLAALEALK